MCSVIIPTHNAADYLPTLIKSLRNQTIPHELIFIDSQSDEKTQKIFAAENVHVISIRKEDFNHGATRNLGAKAAKHDIVIFLTQDALPVSPQALKRLVDMLTSRPDIAVAYGRQLPYPNTGTFGQFARLTNYPYGSIIKTKASISEMGIKTCSCSNSFAAYRKADLLAVGGFPANTILGEDVSVAARFILNGKAVAYCAEAEVFHSHDYTILEEFKRYFDIGVFHYEQRNLLKEFNQAESQGFEYVLNEWKYLINNGYMLLLPAQIARTSAKYIGYKLGVWERFLPTFLKRRISMHPAFWGNSINTA